MSATYVYIVTDADGDALYVGHTCNLFQRLRGHRGATWAERARKVHAYVYARKDDATRVERDLITDLEPEFNIQGNPRHMSFEHLFRDELAEVERVKSGAAA